MHRVILADNQPIFRAGAARVMALDTEVRLIAQVSELPKLVSSIQSFRSSTAIFSTGLKPDLRAISALLKECGSRGILVTEDGERVDPAASAELGGVIPRSVTAVELTECVRRVARGQRCVQITQKADVGNEDIVGARVRDRLTPKEMQIVALIVQGCKNKEIAHQLGTKEQVIKNYLRSIYDKTGVSDRLELALFTLHHRILAEAAARVGSMLEMKTA